MIKKMLLLIVSFATESCLPPLNWIFNDDDIAKEITTGYSGKHKSTK